MKPKIAPIKLGILSITTLCIGLASTAYADDHGSCSLANVAGILGLHLQGGRSSFQPAPYRWDRWEFSPRMRRAT